MSVNKVILVGRAGKDPEIRTLNDGKKVASFTLATNDYTKDAEGNNKVQWHNVTLWEGLAKIAEDHLKKGAELYIEGRISYEQYTNKEGVLTNYTRITGERLQFVGSKKDNSGSNGSSAPAASAPAAAPAKAPAKAAAKAATPAPAMADTEASDDLPF